MSSLVVGRDTPWQEIIHTVQFPDLNRQSQVRVYPDLMTTRQVGVDLKNLLVRCQAVETDDRPSLAEVVQTAENALTREASDYGGVPGIDPTEEWDEVIHQIIQEYVLDDNDHLEAEDIPLPPSPILNAV